MDNTILSYRHWRLEDSLPSRASLHRVVGDSREIRLLLGPHIFSLGVGSILSGSRGHFRDIAVGNWDGREYRGCFFRRSAFAAWARWAGNGQRVDAEGHCLVASGALGVGEATAGEFVYSCKFNSILMEVLVNVSGLDLQE